MASVPALTGNITLDTTALDNTVLQLGQSMKQLIVQQQQQNQVLNQTLTQSKCYATISSGHSTEPIPISLITFQYMMEPTRTNSFTA